MKNSTNSIKVTVILFFAFVMILAGCNEKGDGNVATHIPPYLNGGESTPFPDEIPDMSPELIHELKQIFGEGAGNTPFLILPNGRNGEVRLVKNSNYERRTPNPTQPAKELTSLLSIAILFFKNSPGCAWVSVGNRQEFICEKV